MNTVLKRICAILFALTLVAMGGYNAAADVINQDVLAELINADPLTAPPPNQNAPQVPSASHNYYFPFTSDHVMKGVYSSTALYFNLPEYWNVRYVYAKLEYRVSPLVTEGVPASLSFSMNDKPFYACRITYRDAGNQVMYIRVPMELLKEGFNLLEIKGYMKLYDYGDCSEEYSQANWVNISQSSFICAGYDLKDHAFRISSYPYPFVSSVNPAGEGAAVMVSDAATSGEIAAASLLMADLSSHTQGPENRISFGRFRDAEALGARRKIVVSLVENLPDELRALLDIGQLDLTGRAVVHFGEDGAGNPLLIIAAEKAENLLEAAHMLLDQNRRSQEKTSRAFVAEGSADTVREAMKFAQMAVGNYTVGDLAGGGITFIGPFHREKILYLPFNNKYVVSPAGKMSFKFRYSENLDFRRSLITVFWDNIPIASKKLSLEKAAGDELSFSMPLDVVGTAGSSIKIAFDLEIPDMFCTMRQDEMPWAYVTADSTMFLPPHDGSMLSFDYMPYPYQSMGVFSDVMVVTGDDPGRTELELLGKTIALYGNRVGPYGYIRAIRAGEFDPNDADYNIIAVGTHEGNGFIRAINDNLHFKYNEAGTAFLDNSHLVLGEGFAKEIAALQLLRSPYAEGRSILAVCGTKDETLETALGFLGEEPDRWSMTGDCALIDSEMEARYFQFIERPRSPGAPLISDFVKENKPSVIFTITAVAAMLMLLLAAIIIMLRSRINRNEAGAPEEEIPGEKKRDSLDDIVKKINNLSNMH